MSNRPTRRSTLALIKSDREKAEALGAKCSVCPLQNEGACVFGEGPANARYAIVGEAPGPEEVKRGQPFIGRSGEFLESILNKLHMRRSEVFITNALLHMPPEMDLEAWYKRTKKACKDAGEEFHDPVACCKERLFRELRIPRCARCKSFQLGAQRCFCKKPDWIPYEDGLDAIPVVIPVGNAAMRALLGFDGITDWRGSRIDAELWRATGRTV